MIDIKLLEKKDGPESYYQDYCASLKNRGGDIGLVEQVLDLNKLRKEKITKSEAGKARLNKVSQEIAAMKRSGQDASALISEMQQLGKDLKDLELSAQDLDKQVTDILLVLPNKCHPSVPVGRSSDNNQVVRVSGTQTKFDFQPKNHDDLGVQLGVLDFERAGKVTGARFTFLKGAASQLERALIQFMLDLHTEIHGYTEMIPPFMVNSKSLIGTGNLPKFAQDLFHLESTDYYLVPTAEVPVTNYFAEEILPEESLPTKFAAYTPCFRSEAGSHGRDTKGLIRQHQFNKVELMVFSHPSRSHELHEALTSHAESVLDRLELPYRRSLLCTGDMGFGAAKCFDLEVWMPGQNEYREISSCSNFEDFQARRANIRFRPTGGGKPQFLHTINGSGLAVGRTLIAIFENYQKGDGSIEIPQVLQPYMRGKTKIEAK